MAAKTIWWKMGDHDKVQPNNTKTKTHDLCPECGQAYGVHGKVGPTLVHPGDTIVVKDGGTVTVEHPDPMAQALAALEEQK